MKAEIKYNNPDATHIIKIKRCSPWWWLLLLLLLPLLLLIKCNKEVAFIVVNENNQPQSSIPTHFEYAYRKVFDFNTLRFNTYQLIAADKNTDEKGVVVFKPVLFTVYQWLFYFNETATVYAQNECSGTGFVKPVFRTLGKTPTTIVLKSKGFDNGIRVKDLINGENLPQAKVKVTWEGKTGSPLTATTDATGIAFLSEPLPLCKKITIIGSCKGYIDSTYVFEQGINNSLGKNPVDIKLRPEQVSLLILAKDAKTLSPISLVKITITDKNGKLIDERLTNSGGKIGVIPGSAEFKNLSPSLNVSICGVKEGYKQKCIQGAVRDLKDGSESKRTLLLEPGEGALCFWVKDKQTELPIAGANVELIKDGQHFYGVTADDGSVTFANLETNSTISIVAKREGYHSNDFTIRNKKYAEIAANDKEKRTIRLEPNKPPEPPPPPPPPPPPQNDDFKGKSGDLRINLQWKTIDDLDLFVTDPCGNTIWALELTHSCRGSTGVLDIDANTNRYPRSTWTNRPQENIYFEKPAPGVYKIQVEYCSNQSNHIGPVPFNLTIIDKGVRKDFSGSVPYKKKIFITNYTVN